MSKRNETLIAEINSMDSIVHINGEDFMGATLVNEDGFFWVCNESGEDFEAHVDSVDHVTIRDVDEYESADREFANYWNGMGFDVDGF